MFNIYVQFSDSNGFEDTFNPIESLDDAKHFANRWKQGAFTYLPDEIKKVRVLDSSSNIVYEI